MANNTETTGTTFEPDALLRGGFFILDNYENIIGFDALYASMNKCKRGTMWKCSVAAFVLNGEENILKLERDLKSGTYKPKRPVKFCISSPKPREILSVCFRDRVYLRSLNDNAIYPMMTRGFIYDNWACQRGKGTDPARDRLSQFMHSAFFKYGLSASVLQCDIKGYYPNMSHSVAERCFEKRLPTDIYKMAVDSLRSHYEGDRGYNPGSQMLQIAGISVLDPLDHFIKERLHIHFYLRYMDDFILIHPDELYLFDCKNRIAEFLEMMEFELHPKKTKVYHITNGIDFLGFHFRLTQTGKVIKTVLPKKVKAYRKKLRRLVAKSKRGEFPKEKVDASFARWKNNAGKGNSYKLIKRMEQFYKELWEE